MSERQMHRLRFMLTFAWLLLIISLFWDPSALLLKPFLSQANSCVKVQGECLPQASHSIPLFLFWSLIVPGSILLLLVFGHETWRRICPLSFLSQIPRALGIQRKRKVETRTGATRYELVKIRKDSWLGKNHLYVQFGLLTAGLAARLLILNADRLALGIFLLLTIGAAIAVGYLYEGKSWCQYFCPMAPVQMVFTGTRGLLGSEAHQGQKQTITQSMCRTVDKDGNEKSSCVGCQSPCIDIDAERNYWETFTKPGRRFVQYGYVGLLLGFFVYYFLYSGSFDYLFSGAWLWEPDLGNTLFNPGFYVAGQPLPIPKLVAVPMVLGVAIASSYFGLMALEKTLRNYLHRQQKNVSSQQAAHILFSICTFFCFNIFFFFSSRALLKGYPIPVHLLFTGFIVLVSTLWLSRTLERTAERYSRESLVNTLRRQLSKLTIDFSRFLEGRSMEDLKAEEVYVLAKVLPGFNQEHSLQVYKGVLRETLEQGNADSASSLEVLRQIRQELNIKDDDHFTVLTELGIAEPELLDPQKHRTRESQLRLESYRQALASTLLDLVENGMSLQEAMQRQKKQIQFLKLEYGMTAEEEEKVLSQLLAGEQSNILRKADLLLEQMKGLSDRYAVLSQKTFDAQTSVFKFLRLTAVQHKQHIITRQMLGLLEVLGNTPDSQKLAHQTYRLIRNVLPEIIQASDGSISWKNRLHPEVFAILEGRSAEAQLNPLEPDEDGGKTGISTDSSRLKSDADTLVTVLEELLHELDPLIQTPALYGLSLLEPKKAQEYAKQLLSASSQGHWLAKDTAQILLDRYQKQMIREVQTLIVQIHLPTKTEKQLFQQSVIRVGSHPSNDIVIPDKRVAKHHAVLYLEEEAFHVLDLGVHGGLYVDDLHLSGDRDRLMQGQVIRFSEYDEPAITVYWKKQPLQTKAPTEVLGTLDKVLLLFESRFFRTLKPETLIELGRDATVNIYPRGTRLCNAGDMPDSILLLIDGMADVMISNGGSEQVLGKINAGETLGEMGVLTRQKRSASVVSASDYCRALVIQADKFDSVLYQDPEIARNLLVVLSSRLQSMTNNIKSPAKV
ncbi:MULTISPECIES: cyclic nucleotide-binding domain-containing protein [unclassified Leptolyngbya]|uniref:cyclic nucleotide-binding domain-containing protein n=1 Tax=unclassified Leptolyngbya TaxID=2650499 RepID=UPI001689D4EF|nr:MULTISPECIES: cyclic nucleotide-binding domain-containing protein [unclassified Leptolyngbya]MBD2157624.1 cyclic nucleotide-binding domain-containing protein [Leptolyngbya sp. FACHB-16]